MTGGTLDPPGAKCRHIQGEYKGMTTLPDRGAMSSPRIFFLKRGLDVGKSQKWPYQHLRHFIIEFYSNIYNIRSPTQNSEKEIVLCKNGDDITRFDGSPIVYL
jgi:hypothetical protein